MALLISLIATPLSSIPLLLKGLFNNLILILLISSGLFFLLKLSFISSLYYSAGAILLLIIFQERKLVRESFISIYVKMEGNFRFSNIMYRFIKENEKVEISPPIYKKGQKYRVISYGVYGFNPTDNRKLLGFVVIDESGELVKDESLANEIVNLFLFWRHIYFNPILGEKLKLSKKPYLKFWIKFQEKFKTEIEKRVNNEYKEIQAVKSEEFTKILKELDQEVLDQYSFVNQKLKLSLHVFDKIYDIFLKPSAEFYKEIYDTIEEMSKIAQDENIIWSKRLKTWENLYEYKKDEIKRLSDPHFKLVGIGILGDIVNSIVLKQQTLPIGGATLVGLTVEGSKAVKKKTLNYINEVITHHKFGIDAIKKNMEFNDELKDMKNKYKQILSANIANKIRNFN